MTPVDAEAYSNAWHQVMGAPARRLLCTWHVDRAWRNNLSRIKKNKKLQVKVYQTLRILLELRDICTFTDVLQQFLTMCSSDSRTSEFGTYFQREYASRPKLWAYCYRMGLR